MKKTLVLRAVLAAAVLAAGSFLFALSALAADLKTELVWPSQGSNCSYEVRMQRIGSGETSQSVRTGTQRSVTLDAFSSFLNQGEEGDRYEWRLFARCPGESSEFQETGIGDVFTFAPGKVVFENPIKSSSFADLLGRLLNFLFNIAIVLTPIMAIVAGFYFLTAAGDPSKVKKAQDVLLWTAVGFGVILLSKGLVSVLQSILGI